jgi:hypothetical protein
MTPSFTNDTRQGRQARGAASDLPGTSTEAAVGARDATLRIRGSAVITSIRQLATICSTGV